MFAICDIDPSCLPRIDVNLLKIHERVKVSNNRHNDQLSKLSSKGYKYSRIL